MPESFEEIKKTEDLYQLGTYKKLPLSLERGKGVYVYDSGGKEYLDLYGGHAVALTGHCHPKVVDAVETQARKLVFYSNVVYSGVRARASQALLDIAPQGMNKVFFCNSGAEANETAIKIARKHTGRRKIISMKNGFHGRTAGALSATDLGDYRSQFSPLVAGHAFVEFGNMEELEAEADKDTAGIILEPVQSMAGVEVASDDYYRRLRSICSQLGTVLIFDEVQTGFGRTGCWFFGDRLGISPDVITLAKGIGGGVPIGAVLIQEGIARTISQGEHGSTFGGGPLASAALLANIRVIKEENLVQNAVRMETYFKKQLSGVSCVKRIKGRGLLLGIEIEGEAGMLRDYLLQKGVITGTSYKKDCLRLLPPLILNPQDAQIFIGAMKHYRPG
ncbi:MAG: aspartate aminotransferase family protein [Spirochaetota bacterium]